MAAVAQLGRWGIVNCKTRARGEPQEPNKPRQKSMAAIGSYNEKARNGWSLVSGGTHDVYHVAEVAGFDHDISVPMLICRCQWHLLCLLGIGKTLKVTTNQMLYVVASFVTGVTWPGIAT
jgi:hypothetical protein